MDSVCGVLQRYEITSRISVLSGPRIATNRNVIVREFLKHTDAEYLLMLDTDMVFSAEVPERLMSWGLPIVGALCFSEDDSGKAFPVIYKEVDGRPHRESHVPTDVRLDVAATGAACLLVRRDALLTIGSACPPPHPWFEETTHGDWELGEDVTFCLRARANGIPVVVDTGCPIGHVKSRVITEADFDGGS